MILDLKDRIFEAAYSAIGFVQKIDQGKFEKNDEQTFSNNTCAKTALAPEKYDRKDSKTLYKLLNKVYSPSQISVDSVRRSFLRM